MKQEKNQVIRFDIDYGEGAIPEIMDALQKTNLVQSPGYGTDDFCHAAADQIKMLCQTSEAEVHFLTGGTQCNLIAISSVLRPYQGVVAPDSGHIAVHETGAIEATGHKVLTLPADNGKITARQVQDLYESHWGDPTHEHSVQPGMVYISQPTECGTVYDKTELTELSRCCRRYGLPLYMDGARLCYALGSHNHDLTLEDYAHLTDLFYIGGTKCGCLFGEALVIVNPSFQRHFRYSLKHRGGMLAKGRLLGLQFSVLMENDRYRLIGQRAVAQAERIRKIFAEIPVDFLFDSPTNQQFPILSNEQIERLASDFAFERWQKIDENRFAVRFCTSWATRDEDIAALESCVRKLPG